MTDLTEELRIIARDGGRLSPADRVLIAQAADELDHASALLARTQSAMIEAQAKQIATAELLLEQRRKTPVTFTAPPLWRISWNYPPCP